MHFSIQTSQPKNNAKFCSEDKKLSEAIETIFPMMTEDGLIIWNTIRIPLSYKYDISYMIEDILCMLRAIRENHDGGKLKIDWPSDTFACRWKLTWDRKNLAIDSDWRSVSGNIEQLLNKNNKIIIDSMDFVREWKMLLRVLITNLRQCGYNECSLIDMSELINEFRHIDRYGSLYQMTGP